MIKRSLSNEDNNFPKIKWWMALLWVSERENDFEYVFKNHFQKRKMIEEKYFEDARCACKDVVCIHVTSMLPVFQFLSTVIVTHCNTVRHMRHTATHCSTLQRAVCLSSSFRERHSNPQQPTATRCNTLQHTATHCNTLQQAVCLCSSFWTTSQQHAAPHCNILQHTVANSNTLQHTATHCNKLFACLPVFEQRDSLFVCQIRHSILPPLPHLCCSVLQCVLQCFAVCVAVWCYYTTVYSHLCHTYIAV